MLLRTHIHDNGKFTMNLSMIETVEGGGNDRGDIWGWGHEGRSGWWGGDVGVKTTRDRGGGGG